MCPTPRKNPAKGSQRGKHSKKPKPNPRQSELFEGSPTSGPPPRRKRKGRAKKKGAQPVTVQSLAELGCQAEDIILQLSLNLDDDQRKAFNEVVSRGHAKHRNVILKRLDDQAGKGTTTAAKALANVYLERFQGMEEDFDEEGLSQRVEAEIDRALEERKVARQVDRELGSAPKKPAPKKRRKP